MSELISIIIPAYNVAPYIGSCIQSLLCQTHRDIEIIVVNDGSHDETGKILEDLARQDKRITYLQQENGGAAAARNLALAKVHGEYITFVDGDDTLTPDTLEKNVKFLRENDSLDWVSFPVKRVPDKYFTNKHTQDYGGFAPDEEIVISKKDYVQAYFSHQLSELCCGTLYRWSTIKDIRFPAGLFYEDSFYFTEALCHSRNGQISKAGAYLYLVREGSSQRATLNYARLHSKLMTTIDRITKFRQIETTAEQNYQQMISSLYYTFLFEKGKNNQDAQRVIEELIQWNGRMPTVSLKQRIYLLLVSLVGYKRLRNIYKCLTSACK